MRKGQVFGQLRLDKVSWTSKERSSRSTKTKKILMILTDYISYMSDKIMGQKNASLKKSGIDMKIFVDGIFGRIVIQ